MFVILSSQRVGIRNLLLFYIEEDSFCKKNIFMELFHYGLRSRVWRKDFLCDWQPLYILSSCKKNCLNNLPFETYCLFFVTFIKLCFNFRMYGDCHMTITLFLFYDLKSKEDKTVSMSAFPSNLMDFGGVWNVCHRFVLEQVFGMDLHMHMLDLIATCHCYWNSCWVW